MNDLWQKILAASAATEGLGTVLMGWFDAHAAGIGAICTVVTLIAYLTFSVIKLRKDKKDE